MTDHRQMGGAQRSPSFAAIIAHADDAEMLERCIAHHLAIGVDFIFVSLNLDDDASARTAAHFACENVRVSRVEAYARDQLDYFTAAKDLVAEWADPDWLMFVDSDEFWIPAAGAMRFTSGLESVDAFRVQRFNVPPVRTLGGRLRDIDVADPHLPVIGARLVLDAEYLTAHPEVAFIQAKIGPKLMARTRVVGTVLLGAHDFIARAPDPRVTIPTDLLIVHVPFTTRGRFDRKMRAVRVMLKTYGDRFGPGMGWHWRRWLTMEDAGILQDEFDAQVVDEGAVPDQLSRGVLTTPARIFATDRLAFE